MSYIFGLLLIVITIGVGVVGLSILDDLLKEKP